MADFAGAGSLFQPVRIDLTSGYDFLQRQMALQLEKSKQRLEQEKLAFDREVEGANRQSLIESRLSQAALNRARTGQIDQDMEMQRHQQELYDGVLGALNGVKEGSRNLGDFLRGTNDLLGALEGGQPLSAFPRRARGALGKTLGDLVTEIRGARNDAAGGILRGSIANRGVSDEDVAAALDHIRGMDLDEQEDLYQDLVNAAKHRLTEVPEQEDAVPVLGRLSSLRDAAEFASKARGELERVLGTISPEVLGEGLRDVATYSTFSDSVRDRHRFWSSLEENLRVADEVVSGREPLNSPAKRDALEGVSSILVAQIRNRPTIESIDRMGEIIRRTGYVPSSIGGIFEDAAITKDPIAMYKAARLLDEVSQSTGEDRRVRLAQVRQTITKRPGGVALLRQLELINAQRRASHQLENELTDAGGKLSSQGLLNPLAVDFEQQLQARQEAEAVYNEALLRAASHYVEASAATSQVTESVLGSSSAQAATGDEQVRSLGAPIVGSDGSWFFDLGGSGIMDELDESYDETNVTHRAMAEDLGATYARLVSGRNGLNHEQAVKQATDETLARWGKSPTGNGVVRQTATEYARAQGQTSMKADLANGIYLAQVYEELLENPELIKEGIRPEQIRVNSVPGRGPQLWADEVMVDVSEGRSVALTEPGSGFLPSFDQAGLIEMSRQADEAEARHLAAYRGAQTPRQQAESQARYYRDLGALTGIAPDLLRARDNRLIDIAPKLRAYLGSDAPAHQRKVEEARKRQAERSRRLQENRSKPLDLEGTTGARERISGGL